VNSFPRRQEIDRGSWTRCALSRIRLRVLGLLRGLVFEE